MPLTASLAPMRCFTFTSVVVDLRYRSTQYMERAASVFKNWLLVALEHQACVSLQIEQQQDCKVSI